MIGRPEKGRPRNQSHSLFWFWTALVFMSKWTKFVSSSSLLFIHEAGVRYFESCETKKKKKKKKKKEKNWLKKDKQEDEKSQCVSLRPRIRRPPSVSAMWKHESEMDVNITNSSLFQMSTMQWRHQTELKRPSWPPPPFSLIVYCPLVAVQGGHSIGVNKSATL